MNKQQSVRRMEAIVAELMRAAPSLTRSDAVRAVRLFGDVRGPRTEAQGETGDS